MRLFLTLLIISGIIFVAMIQFAENEPKHRSKSNKIKMPELKKPKHIVKENTPTQLHKDHAPANGPFDILNGISDPREASAVLLVQMAAYDGEITQGQKAFIKEQMIAHQGADEPTSESLYSFGRMAVGHVDKNGNLLGKLTRPIKEYCTSEEVDMFMQMLTDVARHESTISNKQQQFSEDIARLLSVHSP